MFEAHSLGINPVFIKVRGGRLTLEGRTYLEVSFETSPSLLAVDNFDIDHLPNILRTSAEGKPGIIQGLKTSAFY